MIGFFNVSDYYLLGDFILSNNRFTNYIAFSLLYFFSGFGIINTGHFDFLATLSETLPDIK